MNTILTLLIDLLGEVFPIARPTPVIGPADRAGREGKWWRRALGMLIFGFLAALPFLVMRWLG